MYTWKHHKETPLYRYLHFKQAKISCFSFYLFSFFFYNIGEQEGWNKSCPVGRAGTSGKGKVMKKGGRRVNTARKMCNMYVNAKMMPTETI
jgi:hypothetical protein